MKFYSSALPELIKKIEQDTVKALLLHGNNQGFITSVLKTLSKKFSLTITPLSYKGLSSEELVLASNSQNFFGHRELIKIVGVTPLLSKTMKDALQLNKFEHFICFVSNESLPQSGIRKFFEDHTEFASVGCYYDNEQTIAKLILQQCTKRNKNIDEEALYYLRSHLKGDHRIIKFELEKLFCFTHDQETITKDDVMHILSQGDLFTNSDAMCIAFASKNYSNFIEEVEKLQNSNKNDVLIIRALIRYYLNIYIAVSRMENGENIDGIIKALKPPIFFKYVADFKQIIKKYSAADSMHYINSLQKAEMSYKINPKSFDLFSSICSF